MQIRTGHALRTACAALLLLDICEASYSCPEYSEIRQPSVSSKMFNISSFGGTWYMVATTEPTMPPFCTCIHNDVQIHELEGWYAYTSHATCEGKIPISVPVKGELSKDPSSPGLLHENFGLFNHTMSSLDPNMIFEAQYNERGEMVLAMTYACLGWLLPVPPIGEPKFSFNVLSRRRNWTTSDLREVVANATKATQGLLDVANVRFADQQTYASCASDITV
ncbi:hypothetical protein AK812_SmicGene49055 [Symbiodinium microadriaticum]|uniref:Uncharacterized protein n=1 Tax=Symbiodinium microadriaticum TaxID=2951 RepID=A0A1Q9EX01_SYMMI|nr:hypothetical protein AK812_SmicGene49055 [Symbiodinium microadriaticum]CAE7252802.1 unnamed protein product [Symbiodinium microadriaticum]